MKCANTPTETWLICYNITSSLNWVADLSYHLQSLFSCVASLLYCQFLRVLSDVSLSTQGVILFSILSVCGGNNYCYAWVGQEQRVKPGHPLESCILQHTFYYILQQNNTLHKNCQHICSPEVMTYHTSRMIYCRYIIIQLSKLHILT